MLTIGLEYYMSIIDVHQVGAQEYFHVMISVDNSSLAAVTTDQELYYVLIKRSDGLAKAQLIAIDMQALGSTFPAGGISFTLGSITA